MGLSKNLRFLTKATFHDVFEPKLANQNCVVSSKNDIDALRVAEVLNHLEIGGLLRNPLIIPGSSTDSPENEKHLSTLREFGYDHHNH